MIQEKYASGEQQGLACAWPNKNRALLEVSESNAAYHDLTFLFVADERSQLGLSPFLAGFL
jgi:hypothetical protein